MHRRPVALLGSGQLRTGCEHPHVSCGSLCRHLPAAGTVEWAAYRLASSCCARAPSWRSTCRTWRSATSCCSSLTATQSKTSSIGEAACQSTGACCTLQQESQHRQNVCPVPSGQMCSSLVQVLQIHSMAAASQLQRICRPPGAGLDTRGRVSSHSAPHSAQALSPGCQGQDAASRPSVSVLRLNAFPLRSCAVSCTIGSPYACCLLSEDARQKAPLGFAAELCPLLLKVLRHDLLLIGYAHACSNWQHAT